MKYSKTEQGHSWLLEDGAKVDLVNCVRTAYADWVDLRVYAPESSDLIGGSRINISDPTKRYTAGLELSSRNGRLAKDWTNILFAIWQAFDEIEPRMNPSFSPTSQLHSPIYRNEVVKLEPISLCERLRPTARTFIVEDIIPQLHTTLFYGDSGHGKSYIAASIGQCIATGDSFLGLKTMPGRVLYLDWELDADEQTLRSYEVAEGLGYFGPPAGYDYLRCDYPLTQIVDDIVRLVIENEYKFLIVDSYGLACGGNPDKSDIAIPFYIALRQIPCTILLIDHMSRIQPGQNYRDKDAYGSIYKKHLSRSALQVQSMIAPSKHRKGIALRHGKANFSAIRDDLYLWLEWKNGKVVLSSADASEMEEAGAASEMGIEAEIRVGLRELGGKGTVKQIADQIERNEGTVNNKCKTMVGAGKLTEDGKDGKAKVYKIT